MFVVLDRPPDRAADLVGWSGILGFPPLMDGGTVTSPNLAIWTPENGFIVENEGVAPDIDVEQTRRT